MQNYSVAALLGAAIAVPAILWLLQTACPRWYDGAARALAGRIDRMAASRSAVIFGSALFVLTARVLLLKIWPIPRPSVVDEFSYLLMGDTFASGRLVNPPHPLWQHFESLFILQQPTYASVYPILQGLFLAAGERLAGNPWWGVWLSVGVMCAAVAWAMEEWLPRRWALLGAAWVSAQLALTTYSMNSYWGGAAGAAGGAVLAASLGRMRTRLSVANSLVYALGVAMLANSRPYEGSLLTCVTGAWIAIRARRRLGRRESVKRIFVPLAVVLAPTVAFMSFYFFKVTGQAWKPPQQAYIEQYAAAPGFVWQKVPPLPSYWHSELREAHLLFLNEYRRLDTFSGALGFALYKLRLLGSFYMGPLVFVPLIVIRPLFRGRFRLPLVSVVLTLCGILLTVPIQPHYGAPLTAFLAILTIQSLRFLWLARNWGCPLGAVLVPAAPLVCAAYIMLSAASAQAPENLRERQEVVNRLMAEGDRHLVIVRYGSGHALGEEWVYNAADIDGSPVVWARDMGSERNKELLRYYPGRRHWLLESDGNGTRLAPYE
jgi:hypothetical protein